MASILPPIPRYIFTIFEPLSLLAGALAPIIDPWSFVSGQITPNHPALPISPTTSPTFNKFVLGKIASYLPSSTTVRQQVSTQLMPTEHILALQLGNAYLLLMFIGILVMNTTTEARVIHAFIWALWLGDIGHVAASAWMMGLEGFVDVQSWTPVIWGNIVVTILLFASRSLYLAGLLGEDISAEQEKEKVAEKPKEKKKSAKGD